jgi:hypothetical protein
MAVAGAIHKMRGAIPLPKARIPSSRYILYLDYHNIASFFYLVIASKAPVYLLDTFVLST